LRHVGLINWGYNKGVKIEYDQAKRDRTLLERGLDSARADEIFAGLHFTGEDVRVDYPEKRLISIGWLEERLVVLVWTPRGDIRRIISMRKANEREKALFARYLERS